MTVSVALFTSDLRVHDQPVLCAAVKEAGEVVPLFVQDSAIAAAGFDAPNRRAFLADCLEDLDRGLRERGGRLVVRSGDVVEQTCRVAQQAGAREVHVAGGVSGYAQRREHRLRAALEADGRRLHVHDAVVTALPPGAVTPQGRDHFAVFTPYFRRWEAEKLRLPLAAPRAVRVPERIGSGRIGSGRIGSGRIGSGRLPRRAAVRGLSPGLPAGGERAGRQALDAWVKGGLDAYADRHDDLAGDATSRLSPHLHFGTLSAAEVVHRARRHGGEGARAFVRQVAWRDFHHQVLAARPSAAHTDYRTRNDRWRSAHQEVTAWKEGRTGYPVVDAAMRQLLHEGWMHNRARLLVASFLTKTLYVDWRIGARHFLDWLVDGDMANNQLNWQWVAGTGTDTRPGRVLNPLTQARRFDPDGAYVRRWVPELQHVTGPAVHQPWKLPAFDRNRGRDRLTYPEPLVDLADGLERFKAARSTR